MSKFNFNIDIENNNCELSKSIMHRNTLLDSYKYYEYIIDLGLPSGTLWCKYNLGVNLDRLSNIENWYGNYYSWGEIKSKKTYTWSTYKFSRGELRSLTKYCNIESYGLNDSVDNLTYLQLNDDAAYLNLHIGNYKFKIPSDELFDELLEYATHNWIENYQNIKYLNGYVFKGNNQEMFIPAAGYCSGSEYGRTSGALAFVWSSTLNENEPEDAICLSFDSTNIEVASDIRYTGFSVRPVVLK